MQKNFDGGVVGHNAGQINRRNFLQKSSLGFGATALAGLPGMAGAWDGFFGSGRKSVIFLYLAGGPSHLDMYDMKPNAPAEIRGEFRPIATNVPGMRMSEHLPMHAKIADKFSIINGVETIDTHGAAVVTSGYPSWMNRPGIDGLAGVEFHSIPLPHGDWDTHGRVLGRQLSIFDELREKLPVYDRAIYELITSVYDRGLDKDVLIVTCGEFGRTPWVNRFGGRDHWAPCGSVLVAGGGLRMGQMIGDTGLIGERERSRSRPYTAQNVLTMIYRHLGIVPQLDDQRLIQELV